MYLEDIAARSGEPDDFIIDGYDHSVVADRLCGMLADPLIRNAQEKRQLQRITHWLETRGYAEFGL